MNYRFEKKKKKKQPNQNHHQHQEVRSQERASKIESNGIKTNTQKNICRGEIIDLHESRKEELRV